MATPSKKLPERRRAPRHEPLPPPAPSQAPWEQLFERPGRKIITFVAVLTAVAYMFGWLKPVVDSHMPTASQSDVDMVKKDLEAHVDTLSKAVDQTLGVAKAANTAAQQSVQYTNDSRLDRLLSQKIELEDQAKKSPNDVTLRAALAKTQLDIAKLTATPSPAPMP